MSTQFDRLVTIMARLRAPGGCPWDKEQTHQSLKPYLIEEAYEVIEAVDGGDPGKLSEELGDLLLQVVFHAQLAAEKKEFDIETVCQSISDKLTRRHPHVFGDAEAKTPGAVVDQWEKIKQGEEAHQDRRSALDGVPKGLPALMRAHKIQKKAGKVGFEWEKVEGAFAKVDEELGEFRHAFAGGDQAAMEEELGDLFFALVNVARYLEVDPEEALGKTIDKFVGRFHYIEKRLAESGESLKEADLGRMDALWDEAKEANK